MYIYMNKPVKKTVLGDFPEGGTEPPNLGNSRSISDFITSSALLLLVTTLQVLIMSPN